MHQAEEAFAILTAVDLLVLYQTRDAYVLKLQPALNRETFLSNPIYRRLLEQEIGDVAVAELDIKIPQEARDISKNSRIFFQQRGHQSQKQMCQKIILIWIALSV